MERTIRSFIFEVLESDVSRREKIDKFNTAIAMIYDEVAKLEHQAGTLKCEECGHCETEPFLHGDTCPACTGILFAQGRKTCWEGVSHMVKLLNYLKNLNRL